MNWLLIQFPLREASGAKRSCNELASRRRNRVSVGFSKNFNPSDDSPCSLVFPPKRAFSCQGLLEIGSVHVTI